MVPVAGIEPATFGLQIHDSKPWRSPIPAEIRGFQRTESERCMGQRQIGNFSEPFRDLTRRCTEGLEDRAGVGVREWRAGLAQLVERSPCKADVVSSIPTTGTFFYNRNG
jgi:hypothetical protein